MRRRALVAVVVSILLAGCVDHEANARQFCDRHEALLSVERDNAQFSLSPEELEALGDEIETTMRDSEDGTKPVRLAARDLVDAYAELAGLVDDEEAEPDEIADAEAALLEARADARAACAKVN